MQNNDYDENFLNINQEVNNLSRHRNAQYESALLSLVLSQNINAPKIIPYLTREDFSTLDYQQFFDTIKALYEGNISINDEQILLYSRNQAFNLVNRDLLLKLYNAVAYPANIQTYLEEVVSLTKLRTLEKKIKEVSNLLSIDKKLSADDIIRQLQETFLDIDRATVNKDFLDIKDVSDEYYQYLKNRRAQNDNSLAGLATGYKTLDNITQGFQEGQLIILAARPAMGKTALALNFATNVINYNNNARVAFFSLEMSPKQLMQRIYAFTSNVSLSKLSNPKYIGENDFLKIGNAKQHIDQMNLFLDDFVKNDLKTLLWKCRRLHKLSPLSLIVVDYLQLIPVEQERRSYGENRQQEVSKISRALKTLALELKIPIIALSQLSREVEKRENKKPILSDLRESGTIEQDADIVMFLYRDSYYNKKKEDENSNELESTKYEENYMDPGTPTHLIIAKHRNGATGTFMLKLKMTLGKFTDVDDLLVSEDLGEED